MYAVRRLRDIRSSSQTHGFNIVPKFRPARCQEVVSDKLCACERNLHRVQEFGEYSRILCIFPLI